MTQENNNNDSELGKVFAVIGAVAALAAGSDSDMKFGAIIFFMLFMAGIGYVVGQVIEAAIIKIIFLIAAVIMVLINAAIRRFIWEVISGFFSALFGG